MKESSRANPAIHPNIQINCVIITHKDLQKLSFIGIHFTSIFSIFDLFSSILIAIVSFIFHLIILYKFQFYINFNFI